MNVLTYLRCLLPLFIVIYGSPTLANNDVIDKILSRLSLTDPEITDAPLPGYKLILAKEGLFYLSNDGRYLIEGDVYDMSHTPVINVLSPLFMKRIKELADKEAIIYKADKEKYVVTIFTDITCSYCQKLHEQINEYNTQGITIRYLAFPRAGINSGSGKRMQSVWCLADGKKALDAGFKGESLPDTSCQKNNIEKHVSLGLQLGIRGTPAIYLPNRPLIQGYLSPKDLKAELDKHGAE